GLVCFKSLWILKEVFFKLFSQSLMGKTMTSRLSKWKLPLSLWILGKLSKVTKKKKTRKAKAKTCLLLVSLKPSFTIIMTLKSAKDENTTNNQNNVKGKITHLVSIAEKWVTHRSDVGKDQTQSVVSAISFDTKLSKFQQHEVNAQVVEQNEEDYIFATTCFSTRSNSECWLIDSGCTNHMTYDKSLFKDLKPTNVLKVRIGNSGRVYAEGKGTIAISTSLGTKIISDEFKVFFEDQHYLICDIGGREVLKDLNEHYHYKIEMCTSMKNSQKIIESFHNIGDNYPREQTIELLQNELEEEPSI
ncbi:hypothetical protein CR513_19132, partial [Mucuna pruriens]